MAYILPLTTSFLDYPDNHSLAVVVYFAGCTHNCSGCINPELQNFEYEKAEKVTWNNRWALKTSIQLACKSNHTNKIVLTGGDCLHPDNYKFTQYLLKSLSKNYDFCIYTGYTLYDFLKREINPNRAKFIKCGKYDETQKQQSRKTDDYIQLASKNQEIYDSDYNLLSEDGRMYF